MRVKPGDVKYAVIATKSGVVQMVCDTRGQAENASYDMSTPCHIHGYVSKVRRDPNKFAKWNKTAAYHEYEIPAA